MPRRREVPKRVILPDPLYHNEEVAKFINVLMLAGKKAVAERILYGAFEQIKGKSGKDPIEVFQYALSNCRPMVEVKSRRVGGANYQVPIEVRPVRRTALADALAPRGGQEAQREVDGPAARERADGSGGEPRRRRQAARRGPPHGRGQQGLLALPLLMIRFRFPLTSHLRRISGVQKGVGVEHHRVVERQRIVVFMKD